MRSIGVLGAKNGGRRPPILSPQAGRRELRLELGSICRPDSRMNADTSRTFIGRSVPRLEDANLLRGRGHFVDDIVLPGLLNACFVRSPVAHARLLGIDTRKACALPGGHAVPTSNELARAA